MKLYVFNPDADMALGNNEENYMAPATIRRMAEDLALLPIWYAQPGSLFHLVCSILVHGLITVTSYIDNQFWFHRHEIFQSQI